MTRVLVLNTGSSSLKWTVLGRALEVVGSGGGPWPRAAEAARRGEIRATLATVPAFDAVGHRVVHGGARFRRAVTIDAGVRRELEALRELAPEHMDACLGAVDAVTDAFPGRPQVAAFDTAFHATLSEAAAGYALPRDWTARYGIRRYGFHGLSVEHAVGRTRELLGRTPERLVVCHLGSGCSVTAVERGRSVDTSMGFTPLEGLMMATRSGSVDPGLLFYLEERCGVAPAELREVLATRSGLLGVSGVSSELPRVLEAADAGDLDARLAYDRFVLSVRRAVGAMLGVLGGLDALVFTGGIGENSQRVREDATRSLRYAGVDLDPSANRSVQGDVDVARPASSARVLVVHAREDLVIARAVLGLVGA